MKPPLGIAPLPASTLALALALALVLTLVGPAGAAEPVRTTPSVQAPLAVPPTVAPPAVTLDQIGWLAGCWTGEGREPGTVEHWLPAAAGTMFGRDAVFRQRT